VRFNSFRLLDQDSNLEPGG